MFCGECGRSTGARPAQPHDGRGSALPREASAAQALANLEPVITLSRVAPSSAGVGSDALVEPQAAGEPESHTPSLTAALVDVEKDEPEILEPEVLEPEVLEPEVLEPEIIDLADDDLTAGDLDGDGDSEHDAAADVCSQCGTRFEDSDIFCAECGFVRPRPDAAPRPGDTVAYDPFPWGLPRSTEHLTPHVHVPEVAPEPAVDSVAAVSDPVADHPEPISSGPGPVAGQPVALVASADSRIDDVVDVENTRIVSRSPRGDRFVLQFSTGESITVFGTGMVGRHPLAEPGEYFDTFVTIVDPGKSVSKTHLEFGQDSGYFWVSDRFSGNGTVVREPDALPKRCDPGKRYRVARGTRVDIGEQFLIVS